MYVDIRLSLVLYIFASYSIKKSIIMKQTMPVIIIFIGS